MKKGGKKQKIVPDTSVLIDGLLSEYISQGKIKKAEIIIPEFVIDELQAQASSGKEIGFLGLQEIQKLRNFKDIKVEIVGRKPTLEEIRLARKGRIDALIRDVAKEYNAILYTRDLVQAEVAKAFGIKVVYIEKEPPKELHLEKFLTPDTMSLHFKENCYVYAKRGKPGNFKLVRASDKPLSKEELEEIIKQIFEFARQEENAWIEIDRNGATILQVNEMRISIARRPFSNAGEITLVRPIVKLTLDDYKLSDKLKERIRRKAEGIIIAGRPGSGKSTLAASLAEFYLKMGKIVKTMESPRDLQVSKEITQYSALDGDFVKTAEILLLVRPDYTIFDEMRTTRDFNVFSDMRLAGIGMVGVVHASQAIDAIQRFLGRVELGMLPHIVDTVIFVEDGRIKDVYELTLTVKVPTGMTEEDLARPVVEVRSFETGELKYEIYTYGEENVVVPIEAEKKKVSKIHELAKKEIFRHIKNYDSDARINFVGDNKVAIEVEAKAIPKLIGRKGRNIEKLEKKLGLKIEVIPKEKTLKERVPFEIEEKGKNITFFFDPKYEGKQVEFYINDEHIFSAIVGKKGRVKISKKSEVGKKVLSALVKGEEIKCFG